jgi:glycerol-3-phosphate dehydrogenase
VVDLRTLGGLAGTLNVPVPGERHRWVFAIPQRSGVAYVGLTDEPAPGPIPDVPAAPEQDVDFLLATLSATLQTPLTRADVLGTYAGLRPLVDDPDGLGRTSDLSRRHAVIRGDGGLVSVVGGKLTTYRRMAQDAVDAAIDAGGLAAQAGPCRTRSLPLVERHGTEAPAVVALADGDPQLLAPLAPGLDVLGVEVLHAVRAEGALDADDVLDRRTRIGLVAADRERARPSVQALIAAGRQALVV